MTIATAKAVVIAFIEALTPSSTLVYQGRFEHHPEAQPGDSVTERGFCCELDADGDAKIPGPFVPGIGAQARFERPLAITVFYPAVEGDRGAQDTDIADDCELIAMALENPVNAGAFATTTLAWTKDVTWQRTRFDDGRIEVRFVMNMSNTR